MDEGVSDYYVKINVGGKFSNELSNISYAVRELQRIKKGLDSKRQNKALLRKELYELMISLRLNTDKLKTHLPHHEAQKLMKKISEIEKFQKKVIKKKPKIVKKKGETKKKIIKKKTIVEKKVEEKPAPKKEDNMLAGEKRELELLRQDLENISKELQKRQ